MPFQNEWQSGVFPQPLNPCSFKTNGKIECFRRQ